MTTNEHLALLKRLEWSGQTIYRDSAACDQYTCPICRACAWKNAQGETYGHYSGCDLAKAINSLGGEAIYDNSAWHTISQRAKRA